MSVHIAAAPAAVAETVLLPGDPYRARWAAEKYLDNPVLINEVRGMLGYSGTWRGHRVTIHGSGMGMPSMAIYAHELIRDHGARTLIRIGSAGGLQPQVRLHDVVIAQTASSGGSPSRALFKGLNFAPCADFGLLLKAHAAAQRMGAAVHVGGLYSTDSFYDERPDLLEPLERHGVLAVEMETAELYQVAARHACRALSIVTVSDHLRRPEALTAEQRERGLGTMVELALETAFG